MKFRFMLTIIIGVILNSSPAKSQEVSRDSISSLKQQKDVLELAKEVNEQKLKLVKLENSLESKRQDMESAQRDAQKSADINENVASKLSNDPDDKKLARKAKKAAKQAKRDARRSRSAVDDFEDLQKNIEGLKKQIAANEKKLSALKGNS